MSRNFMYVYSDGDIPADMTLMQWRASRRLPKPPTFSLSRWLMKLFGAHMTDEQYEATMEHLSDVAEKS